MIFNPATRTAWLLPPRTASRSTVEALKPHGYRLTDNGRHRIDMEILATCKRVVCTVRHPLDVLVSWWSAARLPDFEAWLVDGLLTRKLPAYKWLILDPRDTAGPWSMFGRWTQHATELARFEDMGGALDRVTGKPVRRPVITEEVRGRDGRPWRDYYTPRALDAALAVFGDEMRGLSYGVAGMGYGPEDFGWPKAG